MRSGQKERRQSGDQGLIKGVHSCVQMCGYDLRSPNMNGSFESLLSPRLYSAVFQHSLLCPTFSCRQLKAIRRLSSQSFRRRAPGSGNLRLRPHVTCSTTISLFATTKTFRSVRSLASRTLYLRRKKLYCLGIHGALDCSTTVGDHSECNS